MMQYSEAEKIEIEWAWKIFKQTETLQKILIQRYHCEFIEQKKKEELLDQMEEYLPF